MQNNFSPSDKEKEVEIVLVMISWEVETATCSDTTVTACHTRFDNGLLIYITDSDAKISSIAIGTPVPKMVSKSGTSSTPIVFGAKNSLITKAIAEKIARSTEKMSIVMMHLQNQESNDIMNLVMKLMENILQKKQK
ncbi:MAG: prenylated flavin chaperone LpdD [Candidatus Helarchaeales archaeon]